MSYFGKLKEKYVELEKADQQVFLDSLVDKKKKSVRVKVGSLGDERIKNVNERFDKVFKEGAKDEIVVHSKENHAESQRVARLYGIGSDNPIVRQSRSRLRSRISDENSKSLVSSLPRQDGQHLVLDEERASRLISSADRRKANVVPIGDAIRVGTALFMEDRRPGSRFYVGTNSEMLMDEVALSPLRTADFGMESSFYTNDNALGSSKARTIGRSVVDVQRERKL